MRILDCLYESMRKRQKTQGMKRLEKISVFLLILYYAAHIYAVHIHLSPDKLRDLNPASSYTAKSNEADSLSHLKLHYQHLSPRKHVNFDWSGKLTFGTDYRTKTDEPSSVVLIQHAAINSNVLPFSFLINKAPPIYFS